MECKQNLIHSLPISSSLSFTPSGYGSSRHHLYSSASNSPMTDTLIAVVPPLIKEERDAHSPCRSSLVTTPTTPNSTTLSQGNRLQTHEEWSSSSSPGKLSETSPINGNPLFGPNGFSPVSNGSYDTYSPNGPSSRC